MYLSTVSVKRPVLAIVMSLVLIVLGIAGATLLQVRQYPDVDPPVVSISTFYRGAPAEVVDADVTKQIIDQLSGIEGIRIIDANTTDENSQIDVEFNVTRDLDLAAADVRDRVARLGDRLPEAADEPTVSKASADSSPIMWISLNSDDRSTLELTDFADRVIVPRLENLSGVAEIRIGGERRYAMRLWLDRDAMAARGVTVNDIVDRLREENVEVPSGRIESKGREFAVRTLSRLGTPEAFEGLVLRDASAEGSAEGRVLLGDVADIELGAEDYRRYFRTDGELGVALGVVQQSDANTLEVATLVREELASLTPTLPADIRLRPTTDDSVFIRASIEGVVHTLVEALVLVFVVTLLFMGSLRAAIIPSAAIPASLIAPLFVLYLCGYSINVLTLLAAVLAIGLVVDDAIVVLENVERRIRHLGEPPLLAAVRGTAQVGFAVVATTVVLVAVFVPLSFLTGKVGRLFTEFGIAMAVAIAVSGFVALTLSPMLCSRLLKPHDRQEKKPGRLGRAMRRVTGPVGRAASWSADAYGRLVELAVRGRWIAAASVVLIAGLGVVLFQITPSELAPVEDQGRFFVNVEAPEGASAEYTLEQVKRAEAALREDPEIAAGLGPVISIVPSFGGGNAANTGRLVPRLKPFDEREITQQEIVARLRPKLAQLPGARMIPINRPAFGIRGTNQPIQFVVSAPDFDTAQRAGTQLLEEARGRDDLFADLDSSYDPTKPQMRVSIDRDRAAALGLSVARIGEAMQAFLGGREATDFFERGEIYDVILQARRDDRGSPTDLTGIYVRSASNDLIPLSSVVTLEEAGANRELRRVDRLPSIVISGSLAPGATLGEALAELEAIATRVLPAEGRVNYLGESLEFRETSSQLYVTFALALLLVYLALAAQFESFIDPITILLAVPLAVVGGLLALLALGHTLNIYSQIGMILLVGLVAKNGILIVEFANQLREEDEKISPARAAIEAAQLRLRPILMTAIATVLGAIPLVLSSGAGAEGRQSIGAVVVGGMIFSTTLTLFVVPAVYAMFAGFTKPANTTERRLEEFERSHGAMPQPAPA